MSDGNRPVVWQCVHCLACVPGVSPDAQIQFCPKNGCPQSPRPDMSVSEGRRCRNSNCRQQLLTPTANFCHKCQTRQQQLPGQQQPPLQPQPGQTPPQPQSNQPPPQLQPDQPPPQQQQPGQPLPPSQPDQPPPPSQPGQPPSQQQPGQPPSQQQPDQPHPQPQPGQPPPPSQPGHPPPQLQPDQPPPQQQPGQPPPQQQPGQPPPPSQPGQPPPQQQPGQPPPQPQPGQPPPPSQPGQPPPQLQPDQSHPQQQLGQPPPPSQPGQPPPQPQPDQPPPQQQPGQPPPPSQPGQPPSQQQPDQPPPQPQPGQPPPQWQPGQPPSPGQPPPQPQPGQPPPQPQPDQQTTQPQPDQPPPQLQPDQPPPQQQPGQLPPQPQPNQPPPQQQPGQPPPQPQPGQPPPPSQPGQPPPQLQPDQSHPQQQLGQPPPPSQPGQPPPQPQPDQPPPQQQPGQPPPPSQPGQPPPQQQPDQPPPQQQPDQPPPQPQPGQPPPQWQPGQPPSPGQPPPQPQPGQPPPQPQPDQQTTQPQPDQPPPQPQQPGQPPHLQQPGQPPPQPQPGQPPSQQLPGQPSPQQQPDEPPSQPQPGQPLFQQQQPGQPHPQQQPGQPPTQWQPGQSPPHQQPGQPGQPPPLQQPGQPPPPLQPGQPSPQPQPNQPPSQQQPGQPPPQQQPAQPPPQPQPGQPIPQLQPAQPPPQLQPDHPPPQQQPGQPPPQPQQPGQLPSQQQQPGQPLLQAKPDQSLVIKKISPQQFSSSGMALSQSPGSGDVTMQAERGHSGKLVHQESEKKEDPSSANKEQTEENQKQTDKDTSSGARQWNHDHSTLLKFKGLQSSIKKSIQVTFHVLVPLPLWSWDSNSCMHIRFEHKKLGNWEENCGNMTTHRDLGNGWCEMTCTLHIEAEILKHPIPYKYVIYSPMMEHQDDCYEYCHTYSSDPRRCLQINPLKYQQAYGGTYHQYDTVVYPKNVKSCATVVYPKGFKSSKSFYEKARKQAKTLLGKIYYGLQPQEENFLSPFEMGHLCLLVYLDGYEQMLLSGSFPQQTNLKTVVEEICHIFHLLYCPNICHQNSSQPSAQCLDGKFTEVMKKWLESVVDALRDGAAGNTMKQLASALCVTHCLLKVGIFNLKVDKLAHSLVGMLQLKHNSVKKECPDYEYLCEILPKKDRIDFATSIAVLCKKTRTGNLHEWLCTIPLYHFLKAFSKPYQRPPETFLFNQEQELELDGFRNTTHYSEGFIVKFYSKFKHLFILDPLLLQVVIYICPKKDLSSLFECISPILSTAWLIHVVSDAATKVFNDSESEKWIGWLVQIQQLTLKNAKEEKNDPQALVSMVTKALLLYRKLTMKLKSHTPHHVDVLKASISLILFAVAQLKADRRDEVTKKTFAGLNTSLWHWITDRDVIGGSVFGGSLPIKDSAMGMWKPKEELDLWQSLLSVKCPSDQHVTEQWHNIAKAQIQKRMSGVPDKWKLNLVCLLEEHENIHIILSSALMKIGTEAIDILLSKPAQHAEQDFERLAATKSMHVGRLLGILWKKKYPKLRSSTIPFDDMLLWSLWPNFIKLYESESKLKDGLPQECLKACGCALSVLQNICEHIQKCSVTVNELQKIKNNYEQMKRLCEVATSHGSDKHFQTETVDSALEELAVFEEHRFHLSHLCSNIPDMHGLHNLKQDLKKDFSTMQICTLCVRENQNIRIVCFQSAGHLSAFADKFYFMNHKYSSNLFTVRWKEAWMVAFPSARISPTPADIHSKVWVSAFHSCQSLLQELHDRSMKLAHIDKHFMNHKRDLEMQLDRLFEGVNACLGKNRSGTWIREVVDRIYDYWLFCNYQKAASIFLELKEALNLRNEDFSDIEKLATEVTSFKKSHTLETMDERLIKIGKFLEDIGSDPSKLECLKCFAKCQEVIKWLREVTNDVNDLQNFVNVALATAAGGEDDLTHDKLSDLRTVGSGFGPLIYNLPEYTCYADLTDRCESLWEALRNSQDLPGKLVYCNQQLEWYKSVKETHGSVEVTSFGKMRNILRYGRYRIGSNRTQTAHSIHDMVHLKLENTGKQLPQTNFSLDDLRDLESKLVLITGNKAESRKEVDQFLNTLHSVCRIADVLLLLQHKGNVKYTKWILTFNCAVDMFDRLQQQAKEMEEELRIWEDEVQKARKEYYELNYYTTMQLLTLRKELGKLKTSGQPHVNPHVLTLLQSISTEISPPCVCKVVKGVAIEEQRETGGIIDQPKWPSLSVRGVAWLGLACVGLAWLVWLGVVSLGMGSISLAWLCLAWLGMVWFGFSLANDILASARASCISLQQPMLSYDQLSVKQKEIFDNLMNCGYSKRLILRALEKFVDQHEAENWITENANQHGSSDDESERSDIDEEEEAGSDSETESETDVVPKATPLPNPIVTINAPSMEPSTPKTDDNSMIEAHVTQKQPVDEFHPTVQELVEAGYSVEQSIRAVEHNDRLEGAMDYLLQSARGGGIFQASTSVEKHHNQEEKGEEALVELQQERVMDSGTTLAIYQDENAEEQYLMLPELGRVLQEFRRTLPAAVSTARHFPSNNLELGAPNLLVTAPERVLRTALALYMDEEDETLPLPTHEEFLICNRATTIEEIALLWQRAIGDPGFKRIFCLLHAEKLSYQVCDRALRSLTELSQGQKQYYRLVIICSNEDEDKSHIISKLNAHRKHFSTLHDVAKCREYLKIHFTGTTPTNKTTQKVASTVDCDGSCVRVVSSTRSGMGKSLFITRMAEKLTGCKSTNTKHVVIPIHGPEVTPDIIMEFLKDHMKDTTSTIFHFDIAPTILWKVDTILFSLLVLRGLSDSQGRVWKFHPTQLYAIEVTLPEQPEQSGQHVIPERCTLAFLDLLPSVVCVSPQQALQIKTSTEDPFKVAMDRQEFESAHYQRVYQYLQRHIENIDLDRFSYTSSVEGTSANWLKIILHSCGLRDPSWAEIRHFVKFLDIQLQSCEASVFCDQRLVGDVMAGLKGFVVKFMIRMSRDFATSSLHGEVMREEAIGPVVGGGYLEQYKIAERRRWEHNSHPYIFFNQDGMSITFVGFIVTQNGDLIDPAHNEVLERAIMTPKLYTGLKANKVDFDEDYCVWQKEIMIEKITTVMGIKFSHDPDESYVLTADNLIKILAIQMKFRCGIPVVIMGETGCGKTKLIRYMCNLARQGMDIHNMLILKVHGGVTESDITEFVKNAEKEAVRNRQHKLDTVVFFDEANTTDAIGLIKEIMCDRRLHGKPISSDLKFIAACNPYRKHSEEMIKKLESAGLGFYVKATNTQQKLGMIPLRQLVYRVLDLPPSMRPLVYDFGQLTTQTEKDYTKQIVLDHVNKHPVLKEHQAIIPAIASVLTWSQSYMRNRQDECSFVSLRDVERAMIVFEYFFDKMSIFGPKMDGIKKASQASSPDPITRSLLLAISICYQARLQDREDYEEGVTAQFMAPLQLPGGATQFRDEVQCCQEVLLDSMILGPNIARNAALRENVFMIAICIELRIPLFLVGKPGSSKSLAKSIVQTSMLGTASNSELLREFKQVHIFSYQCSQLSTPESVIEVFSTAQRFQKKEDTSKYVSVVVLDEVGLAEDSPNLPLKALHPLLEDGTEGADNKVEFIQREERVAFIGISNWALDPAKMNRGVMIKRGNPDTRELQLSARGICSNQEDDPVKGMLEPYFEPLAMAYEKICEKQKREFFGLRDFYCLIKMLYWMCEKSGLPPTWPQLEHAICRNFGGMESDELDTLEEFKQQIHISSRPDLQSIPQKLHSIVNPDCSRLELIKTSLMTKETSWHGENRYLLFLTENYAALEILHHYLSDVVRSSPYDSMSNVATCNGVDSVFEKVEPFILFGSSFPRDKEYTQVCRNINQIKICMETGRTVILLNLENLYESLYDVLNQYYIYLGGSRYVDLGLQTHRVKCRVHNNFKLIMIAEKKTVYEKFPTPLINRLEKHFVLTSSVLTKWQLEVLHDFQNWIHKFSSVTETSEGREFTEDDAFFGYQKETPAAVVFQATHQLEREGLAISPGQGWEKTEPISVSEPGAEKKVENSQVWKENVFKRSQYLLLQTAHPDALVRLERSPLAHQREELVRSYFQQHHSSLEDFLAHHLHSTQRESLLMHVTTHSHLLSRDELNHISNSLSLDQSHVHAFSLQEFDTELDFSNKVSLAFQRRAGDVHHSLLVIQCDSGHLNSDLIACARYRIYDKKVEATQQNEGEGCTHVLFIIYHPRQLVGSSFVGFQGDPWISTHIDNLRTEDNAIMLHEAMGASISQLFYGKEANSEEREAPNKTATIQLTSDAVQLPVERSYNAQFRRLHGCIQQAASLLQDSAMNKYRATKRVAMLVSLIAKSPTILPDDSTFHGVLVRHIHQLLKEREQVREDDTNWILNEALSIRKLQNGGIFQNVLARKLDGVLVPIFSEIIALVDHNYNLNHLNSQERNSPLYQFWLAMFRNQQFHYQDMVTQGMHREQGRSVRGRMIEEDFKCQLPFSWLVKETVDSQWYSAKSTVEESSRSLHLQLYHLVSQTAIGEVLDSVDENCCEEFYQYYLHDFVRSVHHCYHRQQSSNDMEYKLIGDALNSLVHGPEFEDYKSLTERVAALHIVYHFAEPQVFWFGQLISHHPGTLTKLADRVSHDSSEMILHLHAVELALDGMNPPLDKRESEDKEMVLLTSWLNQLKLSRNAINSILNLPSHSELANRTRMKWQLIQALQMFVEHVVLKREGMIQYVRRLQLYLKSDADFLKAKTVDKVKKLLNAMDNEIKKNLKSQTIELTSIRKSCLAFFMELVSTLCFGTQLVPEPALIRMLMDTVFTEQQETELGTHEFSPYTKTKSDEVPVIRSFLLQLLLEHNIEQVKIYLEDYYQKSHQAYTRGELDQNLCLLCIQCFEDALNKKYARKPSQERVAGILREGQSALQYHTGHSHSQVSLGYIEGIAKVRFALSVVAELFHEDVAMKSTLLDAVKKVCTDTSINCVDSSTRQSDITGPVLYLLKLIVRQYGFSCLEKVSAAYTWVVPPELKKVDERTVDPFVIYNTLYMNLRECVSGAMYRKQLQQLHETKKDLTPRDTPVLLLALYQKVTLSRAIASRQLLPNVFEQLNTFILECKILPKKLQWMAKLLVANEQGGTLAQLMVKPRQHLQHRTLGAIVVHAIAVFLCQQRVDVLKPFINMLNNPAALVNAFLPTMPEDHLLEAKRVLGGKFYECPRGHPFFVGECGRPWVEGTCNECGAAIGGVHHKLRADNRNARDNDNTQAGYPLGMPEDCSTVPSPERSLSPAACCIVRALMHSALLWASCNNESAMEGLIQLVKVDVRPQNLPEFFWRHLEQDIELLEKAMGKSMDDSAIIVHLVLKEILLKDPPKSAEVTTVASLSSKNSREQWENIFNQNYIQPILQCLEQQLTKALHLILNDDKQNHDQLFCLVYEHVQVAKGSLDPHLWAYRSHITLEHLSQTLQQQNMRENCPILYRFLQEEPNLRATQYLTDIVHLQRYLYNRFHHRLDRREAKRMTIRQFLQSHEHENVRKEYQKMFESLQKAWELVGEKIRDHARIKVEEKFLLPSFTLNTSLEHLIPTTVGAGVCTTALTDFLVLTHNNFIETCRAIVNKQYQSKSQWRQHKLPITHIHGCHLLTYEQLLPSIILSHCHYSLEMGKAQDVFYDLPALEKHLLDQFIYGKPVILSDIPQVVYQKDIYTAETFAAVRKKVEPQTSLSSCMQQEIIQELRTPDRLRETLDVVDIVLGFLSSGGGRANQSLGRYISHTLKMKGRPFSEKARDCTLGHILSLWQTLSVELARQLTLQQQEPFDVESMPEHFREELITNRDENQVEALNCCLRVLDLDNLLGALFEFIETFVKHSPSNEKEWPLVDTLEVFLERNGLPAIQNFRDEFPETVTLAQAVAVWKHIVWYQERLGTHGTN